MERSKSKSALVRWIGPTALSVVSIVLGILMAVGFLSDRSAIQRTQAIAESIAPAGGASNGNQGLATSNFALVYVELAKKVVPSVVNISTKTTLKGGGRGGHPDDSIRRFFEDFFRGGPGGPGGRGFGFPPPDSDNDLGPQGGGQRPPGSSSLGSGFIIDSSGLILTNNHVIQGADEIKINFTEKADEVPTDAEVVGRDPELDLALLKVSTKNPLVPLTFGDSDQVQVGEYVAAIGNPFGQGHTMTHGIISAKDRKSELLLGRYLQTDAPINPGNSGGPLLNLKGEVIGINNAIDARAQGIGFAIPINLAKQVLPQLKTKGVVARGYIGVLVGDLSPEIAEQIQAPAQLKAPFLSHVYPGQPADKAGLKPYDLIISFNGKKVTSASELIESVTAVQVGDSVPVKIMRAGKEMDFQLTVAERPGADKLSRNSTPEKKKKSDSRPDIGMSIVELNSELAKELNAKSLKGVVVENLDYDGPAAKAGLNQGDIIVEVNRGPSKTVDQFYSLLKEKKKNLLRVRRVDPMGQDSFAIIILDLQ